MRLVYTSDLHGDIQGYRALLDLAIQADAQAAIVGGDLFPHAIRTETALDVQRGFIRKELRQLLEWFHARHPQIQVYLLPGNDDWAAAADTLDEFEQQGLAYPLHNRVYALAGNLLERSVGGSVRAATGWNLAGYACVPLTPFSIKDFECADDGPLPSYSFGMAYVSRGGTLRRATMSDITMQPSIADALASLARQSNPARTIYVCHVPPIHTELDTLPRGRHGGSRALRTFIERYAPPLTLHGHIHEAPALTRRFAIRLGATLCINPGHDGRKFHGVVIDLDGDEIRCEHTVYGAVQPAIPARVV